MPSSMRAAAAVATSLCVPAQTAWTPLPLGPGPRGDVAAAFDPVRGDLVVHGGWNGTANLDETWAFDGTAWRQLAAFPSVISSQGLAFLPSQSVLVSFGGWNGSTALAGTHAFDGTAWTARQPAHAPSPRYSITIVADTARDVLVLFGGITAGGAALDDTWEYDGTDWIQRTPVVHPGARFSTGMAFDAARNHTLLFGGRTPALRVNDTWTWDGQNWTPRGVGGPSPRSTPSMTYDPRRQRIVLFGGFIGSYTNDTWEHDGAGWQQRTPATPPPGRGFAAMAFDDNLGRTVLVGGELGGAVTAVAHSYGPTSPASFALTTPGCGTATLTALGLPWLGDTCHFAASNLGSGTGALFALGTTDTTWNGFPLPLDLAPLGLPGCLLGLAPDVTAFVAAIGGTADYALAVPSASRLLGQPFFVQALATDPAMPAGFAMTSTARAVVGGR